MILLSDVWKCLARSSSMPGWLNDAKIQEVCVAPGKRKTHRRLLVLPPESSPEILDESLLRGTIAVIAETRIASKQPVAWFDTRNPDEAEQSVDFAGPVGFIVEDIEATLIKVAKLWRSRLHAQIICMMGAEGLRTAQSVTKAVLGQRYNTNAPDFLCCDPQSTARALLSAQDQSERLLLRMSLQDIEGLRFFREVVSPHIVSLNNMFPIRRKEPAQDEWFRDMFPDALPPETLLVANGDDPAVQSMLIRSSATVFFYGLRAQPSLALWTSHVESEGREGIRLRLHYKKDTIHVRIPLLGRYSVHTALGAAAVGLISGQSWDEIVAGLRAMTPQLQLILTPAINGAFFLEDSYAATPASTLSILNLVEDLPGRKLAVLGDMIEMAHLETEGHRKVGTRVTDMISYLITVGRLGEIIGREAIDCGMPVESVYAAPDTKAVVERLRDILAPDDMVLVCGARQVGLKDIVDELIDTQASMCEI